MNDADIRQKLRAFIARDLIRDVAYPLTDTEGIVSGGLMDSFALAELGVFVENEFDVYIPLALRGGSGDGVVWLCDGGGDRTGSDRLAHHKLIS